MIQKEAKRLQKVPLHIVSRRVGVPELLPAGICFGARRTNPGWPLEFNAKTVTDIPSLPGAASFFMLCDKNTHLYLTWCGAWGTLHWAPSIVHCVICAMATPSFPRFPTLSSPPFTFPCLSVSFFATYSLGALLFGLLAIRSSQLHTVVSCGARLFPRKRLSWIIVWRVRRLDHPTGKTILKGFQDGNTKEGEPGLVWQP